MTKAVRLEEGDASKVAVPAGSNKGVAVMDLILRMVGIAGTLGAAIAMGTNEQTLPFFTRFVRFNAQYDDFTSFRFAIHIPHKLAIAHCLLYSVFYAIKELILFSSSCFRLFVVVNAIVCAYFVLTIPLSIVHIMRSVARGSRILLIILDTVS